MKYAVLTRDFHSAIPALYYTDNETDAQKVLNTLRELENPNTDMTDEAYWQYSTMLWDSIINPLVTDTQEVSMRDIDNGVYSDVTIINDVFVDTY